MNQKQRTMGESDSIMEALNDVKKAIERVEKCVTEDNRDFARSSVIDLVHKSEYLRIMIVGCI